MPNVEAYRRLITTSEVRGVDQTTAALNKLASAQDNVAVASDKTTRASENMQRRLDNLQRTVDVNYRAAEQLARAQSTLDKALQQGIISVDRHSQLTQLAAQRYAVAANENDKFSKSSKASQEAVKNLGFQINDLATQIAGGTSPFRALAQQGGQIFQVYQQSPTVFGDMARSIASVVTPTRLLLAGLAAVGITGYALFDRWESGQVRMQRALEGTGREAGITRQRLAEIGDASARRAGGSTADARDTVAALANTGRISPDMLGPIADQRRNVQATLAIDAAQANQFLAQTFADPIRGYEEITQKLGGATEAGRRNIRIMVEAGEADKARAALLDLLNARLGRFNELTTTTQGLWDRIGTAISNGGDRFLQYGAGELQAMRARNRQEALAARQPGYESDTAALRQIAALEEQRRRNEDLLRSQRTTADQAEVYRRNIEGANREIERLEQTLQTVEARQRRIASQPVVAPPAFRSEAGREELGSRRGNQAAIDAGAQLATDMGDRMLENRRRLEVLRGAYMRFDQEIKALEALPSGRRTEESDAQLERARINRAGTRERILENVNDRRGVFSRGGEMLLTADQLAARANTPTEDYVTDAERLRRIANARTRQEQIAAAQDRVRLQNERDPANRLRDPRLAAAQVTEAGRDIDYGINRQLRLSNEDRERGAQTAIEGVRRLAQAQTQGAQALESARIQQQLLAQATQEYGVLGERVPRALRDRFKELGDEMARETMRANEMKVAMDLAFERSQLFRSPVEQRVASMARSVYGESYQGQMNSSLMAQARMNEQLKEGSQLASGFFQDLYQGARQSKGGFDFILQAFMRLLDRMIMAQLDALARGLFNFGPGGAGGGGGGFSLGGLGSFFSGWGGAGAPMQLTGATTASSGISVAGEGFGLGSWYAEGGYTGHGGKYEPAGTVHRGEYVFDARSTARLGVDYLSRLRGYAEGGYVGNPSPPSPAGRGGFAGNVIVNNNGAPVQATARQGADGNLHIDLDQMQGRFAGGIAKDIAARRGPVGESMAATYGLQQKPVTG